MNAKPPSFLIAGYFGFGNVGDEAILGETIRSIEAINGRAHIVALSGDPTETRRLHEIESINWTDVDAIANAIPLMDLVIIGGGGLFHDYWGVSKTDVLSASHMGIAFYAGVALLANMHNIPLRIFASGVGPLESEAGRFWTRYIFDMAQIISVRDEGSKKVLQDIGVDVRELIRVLDPVLMAKEMSTRDAERKASEPPQICVAIRSWTLGKSWEGKVSHALDKVVESLGAQVIFLPFQVNSEKLLDDRKIASLVRAKMKHSNRVTLIEEKMTAEEINQVIQRSGLVLGMRLHALFLAVNNLVPFVALSYDPKIDHALTDIGSSSQLLDINHFKAKDLSDLLISTYDQSSEIKKQIKRARQKLRTKYGKNEVKLLKLPPKNSAPGAKSFPAGELWLEILNSQRDAEKNLIAQIATFEREFNIRQAEFSQIEENLSSDLKREKIVSSELEKDLTAQRKELTSKIDSLDADISKHLKALKTSNHLIEQKVEENQKISAELVEQQEEFRKTAAEHLKALKTSNHLVEQKVEENRKFSTELVEQQEEFQKTAAERLDQREQFRVVAGELASITSSRGYRLLSFAWSLRKMIAPVDSSREKIMLGLVHFVGKSPGNIVRYLKKLWQKGAYKRLVEKVSYALPYYRLRKYRNRWYSKDLSAISPRGTKGLVSIVLPVFNGEAYLEEAIDSVLHQSYKNLELIIVDDGSMDGTRKIIKKYQKLDSRIRVVFQDNSTLPVALTEGFKLATGEFLTWVSHDNRMKPTFLETMVNSLVKNPSLEMVYANMDLIQADGSYCLGSELYEGYLTPKGSEHVHLPSRKLDLYVLNSWPNNFIAGAFMYRDRVPLLIGDYSPYQFTREDYDYWMRINAVLNISHIGDTRPLYEYRVHDQSLTHRDKELSITQDRKKLMIFEDFRRDFYNGSSIWVFDPDKAKEALKVAGQLSRLALGANQIIKTYPEMKAKTSLGFGLPLIYVKIEAGETKRVSPPTDLPSGTLKVLLTTFVFSKMSDLDSNWDMIITTNPKSGLAIQPNASQKWIECDDTKTIFTAIDIKSRSSYLDRAGQKIYSKINSEFKISVVICTFRRRDSLIRALRSLSNQSLDHASFEVIVVNNDNEDPNFAEGVSEAIRENENLARLNLRVIDCPIPGLSNARNAGLASVKGEIVLYIDDDAALESKALKEYVMAFEQYPNSGVIGGHILLELPEKLDMPWDDSWKRYWSHFETAYAEFTVVTEWWDFPWGANWAASRQALTEMGGFLSAYGRKGNDYNGGEEIVAAAQIQKLGYDIAVLPQAKVRHFVEPKRFSLKELKRTIIAAKRVQYQAKRNLHILNGISGTQNTKNLGRESRGNISPPSKGKITKAKLIETFFRFLAMLIIVKLEVLHAASVTQMIIGKRQ